jgi:hypothetical protein
MNVDSRRLLATWAAATFWALGAVACEASHADSPQPDAAAAQDGAALYAAASSVLQRSCSYERCHSGAIVGGGLSLQRGADYAASLVGVTACEYERMARVEPFDPDHSWMIIKLTAPFRDSEDPYANYILFDPPSDWDRNTRNCRDQTDDGTPLFGQRMPLTAPNMLPDEDLATLRAWILAGAPHGD